MSDYLTPPQDQPTDMSELDVLLTKRDIPHTLKPHPNTIHEPVVKKLIGYNPAGDWQIIIDDKYSVIRGAVSFGSYGIYNIGTGTQFRQDPERFETPEELVEALGE